MTSNPGSPASLMRPGRLLKILFSYVKPYRARASVLVVTLVLEGAFNVLLALSLKLIIDFAIVPRNAAFLAWIIGSLVAGFLLTATSQVLRDYLYAWFGARIPNDLRKEMFRQLQRLSLGYYARTRTGDIAARFSTDLAAVENAVVLGLPGAIALPHQYHFQHRQSCLRSIGDWRWRRSRDFPCASWVPGSSLRAP